MTKYKHPQLMEVMNSPFTYPIKTVTIHPNKPLKNKHDDDYRGILVEVEYHAGHILRYQYQDNLDLLDALKKFMTPVIAPKEPLPHVQV